MRFALVSKITFVAVFFIIPLLAVSVDCFPLKVDQSAEDKYPSVVAFD